MKTCFLKSVVAVAVTGLFSFAAWAEETEDKTDYELSGAKEVTVEAGDTLTMSGKLTGTGSITKLGNGTLVLNNPESDFSGGVKVNAGYLRIDAAGAIGSGRLHVNISGYSTSGAPRQAIFNAPNAEFANDFNVSGGTTSAGNDSPFVWFYANTKLTGKMYIQSNTTVFRVNSGVRVELAGAISVESKRTFTLYNYGTVAFTGSMTTGGIVYGGNAASNNGTLEIDTTDLNLTKFQMFSNKLLCKKEDVLDGCVLDTRVSGGSSTSCYDLNGFNQHCVGFDAYQPASLTSASTGHDIRSAADPATLTVVGTGENGSCTCYFAINDQVSIDLDADPSYVLNFTKRTHGTTGTISATSGIVNVNDTATFKKATKVVVGTQGKFNLNSTEANALAGVTAMEVAGEFHSTSSAPLTDEAVDLTIAEGAVFDLGGTVRVKSLTIRGVPQEKDIFTHEDFEEIAEGTTIYTPVLKVTDTWTGGESEDIAAAGNWKQGKAPNLTDGGFSPVFAETGTRAEIASPVAFDNLTFTGPGFTLARADDAAAIKLFGTLTVEDDPEDAERTFLLDVPVEATEDASFYLQEHTTLKLADFHTTGSITKAGPGTFEMSGSNVVDGVLSIARNVNRLSGVITTSHGLDLSDVTTSNSVRYNEKGDGPDTVYGKLYLDNVTIQKPFYTSTVTASSHSDATLMAAAATTNRIEGAWKANGQLWQGFKQDSKSVLYVDNGLSNLWYFKFKGGSVYIRNKPIVHTTTERELAVTSGTTLWLEAAGNKVGKFIVDGTVVTTVDGALSEGWVTMSAEAVLDLQGTTQRVEKVTANAGARIVGTEGSNLELGGAEDFSLDCDLADMVSIRKTGAGTMTLAAREFATTGTVAVAEGTLATSVGTKLARRATLSLEGMGVLSVPSGSAIRVHAMKVDGVDLQPGTYSYANIAEDSIRRHFDPTTTGVVNVTGDGVIILVR